MHLRVPAFAFGIVILQCAAPALAQPADEALRRDIGKLLELTGASKQPSIWPTWSPASSSRSSKKRIQTFPLERSGWQRNCLNEEFTKTFEAPDGLTPQLVAIYANYFTHEDVLGLIAFYETELGRKTVATLPLLMQESAAVGEKWGQQHVPRILAAVEKRLRAEGLIK